MAQTDQIPSQPLQGGTDPRPDEVEFIYLNVTCEALVQDHDRDPFPGVQDESVAGPSQYETGEDGSALSDLRAYFAPITDRLGSDSVYLDDEPLDSEYDSDWLCYQGQANVEVSVSDWLRIADTYCMDIADDQVLPEVVVETMGVLDERGITPAVAIEHTDEGFGCMWREPQLLASFYVSVALKPAQA